MNQRLLTLALLSLLALACGSTTAIEERGGTEAAVVAPDPLEELFASVTADEPRCFEASYSPAQMRTKQTVTVIRLELSRTVTGQHAARVTFQQGSARPKFRDLACAIYNERVDCTEPVSCYSAVTLYKTPTGAQIVNRGLRAAPFCSQEKAYQLLRTGGADNVFALTPVECNAGALANPPTVDCAAALSTTRVCTDVVAEKCSSMIVQGTRYADELQLEAAASKRLDSVEECIERFTDVAPIDGCCGG